MPTLKKIVFFQLMAFLFPFYSCKKEYTCGCRCTDTSGVVISETKGTAYLTKKEAKSWCQGYAESGGGVSCNCVLQ